MPSRYDGGVFRRPWLPDPEDAADDTAVVADGGLELSADDGREQESRNPAGAARRVRRKLWHIPSEQWFHWGTEEEKYMEEDEQEEAEQREDSEEEEEEEEEEEGKDDDEEQSEDEEEEHEGAEQLDCAAAVGSSTPARCPPLYTDVLHCIFSFLPVAALCAASSVNHSWRAAVRSQPCSELAVLFQKPHPEHLLLLLQSNVARRHMTALRVTKELRCTELLLLSTLCPSLQVLQCDWLTPPRRVPLSWPSQLRRLDVAVGQYYSATHMTATFESISRLPQLEMLFVSVNLEDSHSWASLSRCTTLRSLELDWGWEGRCTKEQLDVLRLMPFLRVFRMPDALHSAALCHLLRPPLPHPLQLQQLPLMHLDDATAALLSGLPMLRALRFISVSVTDFSFVRRLPHLRSLTVDADTPSNWAVDQFVAAAAAGHFAHVTDVSMEGHTEADVERLTSALLAGRR